VSLAASDLREISGVDLGGLGQNGDFQESRVSPNSRILTFYLMSPFLHKLSHLAIQ